MIVLRLIHIFSGVFWAGAMFFIIGFLSPTVEAAGPEGGRFMQRLIRQRPLTPALATAAGLTTLSGLVMYWLLGGFTAAWFASGRGLALTIGGIAGIIALIIGGTFQGQANTRMGRLAQEIEAGGQPPTQAQMAELQALRERVAQGSVWTTVALVVALIGMSVAQYL
jgi:hypothetical protein